MIKDLELLEEYKRGLEALIEKYNAHYDDIKGSIHEGIAGLSWEIYEGNGYRYCEDCHKFYEEKDWSTLIVCEEEGICVCVNCEQTFINEMEIEE